MLNGFTAQFILYYLTTRKLSTLIRNLKSSSKFYRSKRSTNFKTFYQMSEIKCGLNEKLQIEIQKFIARAEIVKNLITFKDENEKLEVEKISKTLNEFVEILKRIPNDIFDFKNFTDEKFSYLLKLRTCATNYEDGKRKVEKIKKILPYIPFCREKIIENNEIKFILSEIFELEQKETFTLKEKFTKSSLESLQAQYKLFYRQLNFEQDTLLTHYTQKLFEVEETSIRIMKFLQNSIRKYHEMSKEMTKLYDSQVESFELKIQKVSNELRILNELQENEMEIFIKQNSEIQEYEVMKNKFDK